jgi:adenine-specific DNA-methyltransferase
MAVEDTDIKYEGLSKDQLVQLLQKRERAKKLGLVWERDEIEADKAVDANFVACTLDPALCERTSPWRNLVIEGDNFDALRWLRIGFSGRVKCIYIDPPYNTGNKDWVYNDRYFDANDRYRHSTWLEFLFRRLTLARDLLSEDGVILISINDENRARLELLAEEALPGMRVGTFVWRTKDSSNDADRNFSSVHEHVLVYGRPGFSFLGYELSDKKYKNPDNDSRGRYSSDPITKGHSYKERANTYYPIQDPDSGWWYPCNPDSVWRFASEKVESVKKKLRSETIEALIRDKRIIFPAKTSVTYKTRKEILAAIRAGTGPVDGNGRQLLREDLPDLDFWIGKPIALGRPSKKSFWDEKTTKIKPVSSYILGVNEKKDDDQFELLSEKQGKATGEIQEIFGSKVFNYPKPSSLMHSLLKAAVGPGELVLDFFAGAATTAQAVMELNAEDGGERRFIMVSSTEATDEEPEKNICRDITAKRVRLLNATDEDSKYGELVAEFAYLRTRGIGFENLDYDIQPAEVWSILETVHDLPLTAYDASKKWSEHASDAATIVYADKVTKPLIEHLLNLAEQRRNVFVYSWAPGQIVQELSGKDIEVKSVHDILVKRFQQ